MYPFHSAWFQLQHMIDEMNIMLCDHVMLAAAMYQFYIECLSSSHMMNVWTIAHVTLSAAMYQIHVERL